MKRSNRSHPQAPRETFAIAGWLFADLMLALVIVFVASSLPSEAAVVGAPSPTPTATPTATVTPTPSPSPSPSDCIRTAVLEKNSLTVPGRSRGRPPSDAAILRAFKRFTGRQVGLLLTYGHGSTPGAGIRIAKDVNRLLRRELPETVSGRTILEDFFNSAGAQGTVTFDVYLLAGDCV